jgi:hypothetical protein
MELDQMDVVTAVLNGDLQESIYMTQPEGYVKQGEENLVWKLRKALYGLKQAPRAWYDKIHAYLTANGFKRSNADYSLYTQHDGTDSIIIAIYVDDLTMAATSRVKLDAIKKQLSNAFAMTDAGSLHYILGMRIERDRQLGTLRLEQETYINKVLHRFGMEQARSIGTPLEVNTPILQGIGSNGEKTNEPYAEAIGSLMYAMVCTRPDIAFAVGVLARNTTQPTTQHWMAVKRLLRYLRASTTATLVYNTNGNTKLLGYCDADWAGDVSDRKSVSGYVFTLGGAAITWSSKKQATVATSSTEAEYIAMATAAKEAIHLRLLLTDLGFPPNDPTTIKCDNQGAMKLAKNPVGHSRTKHIDVQHHFVREQYQAGTIKLDYIPTTDMTADVLTKPLHKYKHEQHRLAMGLHSP